MVSDNDLHNTKDPLSTTKNRSFAYAMEILIDRFQISVHTLIQFYMLCRKIMSTL